jgi:hypothetical protein
MKNPSAAGPELLFGLKAKFTIGGHCHDGVTVITPGKPPYAGELRCAVCNARRGRLTQATAEWLLAIVKRLGQPVEPIKIRRR